MKKVALLAMVLFVLFGFTLVLGGEKEEIQAKLVALSQEERAINAEWQIFQNAMEALKQKGIDPGALQKRIPELVKERTDLQAKLDALIKKEEPARKEVPKKP